MARPASEPSDTPPEVLLRASRVRLILLDADGVLTDGRLDLGPGGHDARRFHVRDGHGVRLGQSVGLRFGIVSGRDSAAVAARAGELEIGELHQAVRDKLACAREILARLGLPAEAACFVGDDLVDLPVMRHVGLAAAPADADSGARAAAHYVTRLPGGGGAVREIVELVLRASDRWEQAVARYHE